MIEPTDKDMGRPVIYTPGHGQQERGVITGFNDHAVFARYGADINSKGTYRRDLAWEHQRKGDTP